MNMLKSWSKIPMNILKGWTKSDKIAVIGIVVAVFVGGGTALVTIYGEEIRCTIALDQCSDIAKQPLAKQPSKPSPTPKKQASPTTVTPSPSSSQSLKDNNTGVIQNGPNSSGNTFDIRVDK